MKRLLKLLIPAALLLLLGTPAFAQTHKIATVDLSRVFTNYWKFKEAFSRLEETKTDLNKTGKQMIEEWQKAKEECQRLLADANNQAVSAEERQKRNKAAEDKLVAARKLEDRIADFDRTARTTLAERSLTMRNNLLVEIRATINSRAKAGGFTLVFDSAAQTADRTPVLLYSTGEDLTDTVIAQLNAAAPVDATSPEEKKPEPKK